MAIIYNNYIPYYIKSDAIAVFPCANRTNSYASRFTTQYNLTHLGLPNASWISKVTGETANKTTGATVAQGDKISCVINGYFFEFSLIDAYDMEGNQLDSYTTLTAYIDVSCPITVPGSDPLKKQAQLCAIVNGDNQPSALDKTLGDTTDSLFLGLIILKDVPEGSSVSADPLYQLQLASSGKYPYIGIVPQIPNQSITVGKLDLKMFDKQVTTDSGLNSQVSVNGTKLEVQISGKVNEAGKADTAQIANKIMVNTGTELVACTLELDQATRTLTLRQIPQNDLLI